MTFDCATLDVGEESAGRIWRAVSAWLIEATSRATITTDFIERELSNSTIVPMAVNHVLEETAR